MNPNIDQFPMPNTATSGGNMPGAEINPLHMTTEQMPSKEAATFAPQQPLMQSAPTAPGPAIAVPQNSAPAPQRPASMPLVTGTGEELERKWVAIAKSIVERTKDNPYQQSLELSKAGKQYRAQSGRSVNPSED